VTDEVRTVDVRALARVEGEGALRVVVRGDELQELELRIYEPPRFFEALLVGRGHDEPPDIAARICGICPVAYQMSACAAIEAACGVEIPEPIALLRRLLYCGEWIESHALHIYLLHAPDFLGYPSGIAMARDDRDTVERGFALKKIGNALVELIGGRAVHPINVRLGGFHRVPTRRELRAFVAELEQARDLALATLRWTAGFDFPDLEHDGELVALRQPGEYPIIRGRLASTGGLDLAPDEFEAHVVEEHVERSTALHAHLRDGGRYLVGPLARYALNAGELSDVAATAAAEAGLGPVERNPFRSILVRGVEIVEACEEALALIDGYDEPDEPAVPVEPRPAVGCGWTEAPRGLLFSRYELDAEGTILSARIVPPTAQNQAAIEADVRRFVEGNLHLDDDGLRHGAEVAIRNHDPCISCAAHFLDVAVERR